MVLREQGYHVLLALADGPLHGYGIIKAVLELSDGRLRLGAGTLYGALDRFAAEGLVAVTREEVVDGRHRRYYELTGHGRQVVAEETERLTRLAATARRRLSAARPQTPTVTAVATAIAAVPVLVPISALVGATASGV